MGWVPLTVLSNEQKEMTSDHCLAYTGVRLQGPQKINGVSLPGGGADRSPSGTFAGSALRNPERGPIDSTFCSGSPP